MTCKVLETIQSVFGPMDVSKLLRLYYSNQQFYIMLYDYVIIVCCFSAHSVS